jgi:hypothetical protein
MSAIDDLLATIPMDQLAAQLGVDRAAAEQAARAALPALIGGMEANAQDPAGAQSLGHAIEGHDGQLVEGGVDLGQVDAGDGDKIVSNVFGANRGEVVGALGAKGGSDSSLVARVLPLLAPIVMSYLAKQFQQRGASPSASTAGGGGGLADVLGGLLGGAGGLDLGGLLGGGRR